MKIYLLSMMLFIACLVKAQAPCDTINLPLPSGWTSNCYPEETFFPGLINGYITGANAENFTQQANYFDLSSTSYTYLPSTSVRFSKANSNKAADLSKTLYIRVYADNNGAPGAEITTAQTLGQILLSQAKADADAGVNTNIIFPSAIALPASKKFYVSVDLSNFIWDASQGTRDSICISATGNNETTNNAWNYSAGDMAWIAYPDYWLAAPDYTDPLNVSLYIFPYVSTSASACLLPVKLLSFTAVQNNHDVKLTWNVTNEVNMKGYQIEKAAGNGSFTAIKYVSALGSAGNQSYTTTDANAFAQNTDIQYRLQQINNDGTFSYSKVIALQSANAGIIVQNPFTGSLQVNVTLTTPQTVAASLYDMQGKLIGMQSPVVYSSGLHSISINNTGFLQAGTYLLKLTVGNRQYAYKVIKQNL